MKNIIPVILSILMVFSLTACAGNSGKSPESSTPDNKPAPSTNESSEESSGNPSNEPTDSKHDASKPDDTVTGKKVLVAYFSATGTTKNLAEYAADAMSADIYEIVPKQPYTDADLDYGDKNSRSTKEMNNPSSRPAINGSVEKMADYDIVFVGYPIWWGEAPRIISTFMESYDFSGKTIVPFCTSGGSGLGSSAKNLHTLVSDSAIWLDGARLKSNSSRNDMVSWINGLGLDIKAE